MINNMLQTAQNYLKENKNKRKMRIMLGAFSVIVALAVLILLISPGFADEPEYICGMVEHTHTDACYLELICGEDEGHVHDEWCYEAPLLCTMPTDHEHDSTCYAEPPLICGLEESEGLEEGEEAHTHDASCYGEPELICGIEENHVHSETCYGDPVLVCEETGHVHDEGCYVVSEELQCGLPEHEHDESCLPGDAEEEETEEAGEAENAEVDEQDLECPYCMAGIPHGHAGASELTPEKPVSPFMGFASVGLPIGAPDGADLEKFITGVTVKDSAGIPVTTGDFYYEEIYSFTVNFSEDKALVKNPNQFEYSGGKLYYTLPEELVVTETVTGGPILLDNEKVCGWYNLDGDGNVEVWFDDVDKNGDPTSPPINFINGYEDVHFSLTIKAELKEGTGAGTIHFGADADITVNTLQTPAVGLRVQKSAKTDKQPQNSGTETIDYTLVITAIGGDVHGITLTDQMKINKKDEPPYYYPGASDFTGVDYSYTINDEAPVYFITPTWGTDGSNPVMTFNFGALVLNQKDYITLKYTVDFEDIFDYMTNSTAVDMLRLHYDLFVRNNAEAKGLDSKGNTVSGSDDTTTRMINLFFYKDGELDINAGGTTITWTVEVGDGLLPMNGVSVTDDLTLGDGAGHTITGDVTVHLWGSTAGNPSSKATEETIVISSPYSGFAAFSPATGFTYLVPTTGYGAIQTIYYVGFSYDTDSPVTDPGTLFSNGLSTSINADAFLSTVGEVLNKACRLITGPDGKVSGVEYTITLNIPTGNKDKIFYLTDQISGLTPANEWNSLFFNEALLDEYMDIEIEIFPSDPGLKIYIEPYTDTYGDTIDMWIIRFDEWIWPYDDAHSITITYSFPTDVNYFVSDNSSYPDPIIVGTLAEWLAGGEQHFLRNTAALWIDGDKVTEVFADAGDVISKKAYPTDDPRVFDYVVTLNSGYMMEMFLANQSAIFEDEFDNRLEYVENSMYAWRPHYASVSDNLYGAGVLFGPYSGAPDEAVSDTATSVNPLALKVNNVTGKIWADLNEFWYYQHPGGINGDIGKALRQGTDYYDNLWHFGHQAPIQICYQLRVKDEYLTETFIADNTATIYPTAPGFDGRPYSDTASVDHGNETLSKKLTGIDGNIADVEIIINKHGLDLVPDEPGLDKTQFTATDTMSGDLAFFLSSIEIYTQTGSVGAWDGVWVPAPDPDGPGELWSYSQTGTQVVEFILPNEQPVKIVYNALITVPIGSDATFDNTISVCGHSDFFREDSWEVKASSGMGGASSMSVYLNKKDEYNETSLAGAEFELYAAMPLGTEPEGCDPARYITIGGMTFYYLLDAEETSTPGKYEFSGSGLLVPGHGATFLVVETEVPTGYEPLISDLDSYTFFSLRTELNGKEVDLETALGVDIKKIADNFDVYNTPMLGEAEISGSKIISVSSGTPDTAEFEFVLTRTDEYGDPLGGTGAYQDFATTDEDGGEFSFDKLEGLRPGEYYYLLQESLPASEPGNWAYDTTQYLIKITVALNSSGDDMDVDIIYTSRPDDGEAWGGTWVSYDGGTLATYPKFTNTYTPPYGPVLPETGGEGLKMLMFAGLTMMALAGVALIVTRLCRPRLAFSTQSYSNKINHKMRKPS